MIVKPNNRLIQELEATSFTVVGSPGSDGSGPTALQVYADALREAEGDFLITLGDVTPRGGVAAYRNVVNFIDSLAARPVHVVPSASDTAEFGDYFGIGDRAVIAENFLLIMLDNSQGFFSEETLAFFRDTLAMVESPNLVVAFHLPPPNRFSGVSMAPEAWNRFEEAAGVWRKRISLLVCGHGSCYFEDDVDGLRLIVTGGAGVHLHDLDRAACPAHHVVEFALGADGVLKVRKKELRPGGWRNREPELVRGLEDAFAAECREYVANLSQAEEAERRAFPNLARLFRAAARSRLRQARNIRMTLEKASDPRAAVAENIEDAERESADATGDLRAAAEMARDPLAADALHRLVVSGRTLAGLFARAAEAVEADLDIEDANYLVCESCGFILAGYDAPSNCPECGAPGSAFYA